MLAPTFSSLIRQHRQKRVQLQTTHSRMYKNEISTRISSVSICTDLYVGSKYLEISWTLQYSALMLSSFSFYEVWIQIIKFLWKICSLDSSKIQSTICIDLPILTAIWQKSVDYEDTSNFLKQKIIRTIIHSLWNSIDTFRIHAEIFVSELIRTWSSRHGKWSSQS